MPCTLSPKPLSSCQSTGHGAPLRKMGSFRVADDGSGSVFGCCVRLDDSLVALITRNSFTFKDPRDARLSRKAATPGGSLAPSIAAADGFEQGVRRDAGSLNGRIRKGCTLSFPSKGRSG